MIKTYKSGRVRLTGENLKELRRACYDRDQGYCCECFNPVSDNLPEWHPNRYHMAHLKSRGAGGSDSLDNVRTLCASCHMKEHAGRGGRKGPYREVAL